MFTPKLSSVITSIKDDGNELLRGVIAHAQNYNAAISRYIES